MSRGFRKWVWRPAKRLLSLPILIVGIFAWGLTLLFLGDEAPDIPVMIIKWANA